jgi:hypothetical protein
MSLIRAGGAAAPGFRQVGESNCGASDSSPAGVENAVDSGRGCDREKYFHQPMEIKLQTTDARDGENNPRRNGRDEQEAQQSQPDRSGTIECAQNRVGVAKGEHGGGHEAHR